MINAQDLSEKLKAAREAAGLTQAELAQRAGLSLFTLAKLEQGKVSQPSFFTVLALVEQLEISLDELCGLNLKAPEKALDDSWEHLSWCFVDASLLLSGWLDSIGHLAEQISVDSLKLESLFLKYRQQLLLGQTTVFEFEQIISEQFEVPARKINLRTIWFETLQIPTPVLELLRTLYSHDVKIGIIGHISKTIIDDLTKHENIPSFVADSNQWVLGSQTTDNKSLLETAERKANVLPKQLLLISNSPESVASAGKRNWHTKLL